MAGYLARLMTKLPSPDKPKIDKCQKNSHLLLTNCDLGCNLSGAQETAENRQSTARPYVNAAADIPIGAGSCCEVGIVKPADNIRGLPILSERAVRWLRLAQTTPTKDRQRIEYRVNALAFAELKGLSPLKIRLLLKLIECSPFEDWRASRRPVVYPSNATLAKHLRRSERTVRRYLADLVEDGFVTRRYNHNNNRRHMQGDPDNYGLDLSILRARFLEFQEAIDQAKNESRKRQAQDKLIVGLSATATALAGDLAPAGKEWTWAALALSEALKTAHHDEDKIALLKAQIEGLREVISGKCQATDIIGKIATMSTVLQKKNKKAKEDGKPQDQTAQPAKRYIVPVWVFEKTAPINLPVVLESARELAEIVPLPTNRQQFADFTGRLEALLGWNPSIRPPTNSSVSPQDVAAIMAFVAEKSLRFPGKIRNPAAYVHACILRAANDNNSRLPQLRLMRSVCGLFGGGAALQNAAPETDIDQIDQPPQQTNFDEESRKASQQWQAQREEETQAIRDFCSAGGQGGGAPYRRFGW